MFLFISLIEAYLFILFAKATMKKQLKWFVLSAIVLVAFTMYYAMNQFFNVWPDWTFNIVGPLYRGSFTTGIFFFVMIIGALSPKNILRRQITPIRGELSIFAGIITLVHNMVYGIAYFPAMFTNPSAVDPKVFASGIVTIVLDLLLIPLLITSFPAIRKKMNNKTWKKVQILAYLFFMGIYVHVMILYIPAMEKGQRYTDLALYSFLFLGYAVLRVTKAIRDRK